MADERRNQAATPEPGIYPDVPFEEYLQWDAVSNSRLKLATRSMQHYRHGWCGEETKALRMGTLCHTGKLEPMALAERYAVMPPFENDPENLTKGGGKPASPKATGYYRAKADEFRRVNADKTIVEQSEFDRMVAVVKSLAGNAEARYVFDGGGQTEVSFIWVDDVTGLTCKGRADLLSVERRIIGDLKTCRDPLDFERAIVNFGYHRQAALYEAGIEKLTGVRCDFWLVPIETEEPFGCRAAPVDDATVDLGDREVRDLLRRVADAQRSGDYESYTNPESWSVPAWYAAKQEQSTPVEVTIGGQVVTI